MKQIIIPFQARFREAMLEDRKTCTSRTRRMGNYGDYFLAFGKAFEMKLVIPFPIGFVARTLWKQEGCESPVDFRLVWKALHPRKRYDPEQKVWVHWFRRIRR